MRNQFDLEKAEFSDDSGDDNMTLPNQLIELYNKQNSIMLEQTKNFFADCKDFISRFVTLSNLGIGFNLPILLNSIFKAETEATTPNFHKPQKTTKKQKFEHQFQAVVKKMGEVVKDMLNLQVKIKNEYLGSVFGSPEEKIKTRINTRETRARNYTLKHIQKQNHFFNQSDQTNEQEKALRIILQKNMTPSDSSVEKMCTMNVNPEVNLDRLTEKIQKLKFKIVSSKQKQEKIWNIFNTKRPSRNMFQQSTNSQQNDYKELDNMLSDMVSQRNIKNNLSYFQTKESSVYCMN